MGESVALVRGRFTALWAGVAAVYCVLISPRDETFQEPSAGRGEHPNLKPHIPQRIKALGSDGLPAGLTFSRWPEIRAVQRGARRLRGEELTRLRS
ncbi:hypothetical protein DPX16_6420 [Anabarilius grahami]|uniref:Uncharacterized protein n=1 Tax=Anabarilius grahami TaxID=495550 RepID=A0A3N0YMT7_ANAGA|nr:hypothetical protein DPX16_6420 [Anabarilius grahami]